MGEFSFKPDTHAVSDDGGMGAALGVGLGEGLGDDGGMAGDALITPSRGRLALMGPTLGDALRPRGLGVCALRLFAFSLFGPSTISFSNWAS